MSYKIVVDSCCELPEEFGKDERFERVPLELMVGDYHILDDDTFDQERFLKEIDAYPKSPKSACPSPERYMKAYEADVDRIYVVTLSSHLSGSYNSAMLGRSMYLESHGDKNIYVIDSHSASCGETQLALLLTQLEEQGLTFEEIVRRAEDFKRNMRTFFVLDNLDTLRKNGRLTGVKALVASTLSIKPVMGADEGVIQQRGQTIGMKKALVKMSELIVDEVKKGGKKRLILSHCAAEDRARTVGALVCGKCEGLELIILDTAGVSSMYANKGGVIAAV